MLDIKLWLGAAGESVADTCFPTGEAPLLPYICFLDKITREGGDMRNFMYRHSMTIERYSDTDGYNTALEALLDAQALKYTRDKQWLSDMECYLTTYELQTDLIEREVI